MDLDWTLYRSGRSVRQGVDDPCSIHDRDECFELVIGGHYLSSFLSLYTTTDIIYSLYVNIVISFLEFIYYYSLYSDRQLFDI